MPRATASAAHTRTVAPLHDRPPYLGFGLGLRAQHYSEILDGDPAVARDIRRRVMNTLYSAELSKRVPAIAAVNAIGSQYSR